MNQTKTPNIAAALFLSCFMVVCLLVTVVGGGLYLWARQEGLNPVKAIQLRVSLARHNDELNTAAGSDATYREFIIAAGDTADAVANNLYRQALITNPNLFVDYVQYHRLDSQLNAGTYYLQQTQTIPEIAEAIAEGKTALIPLQTIEGWRLEEIAETIDNTPALPFTGADFIRLVRPDGSGAPIEIPADFKLWAGIPDVLYDGSQPSLEGFLFPARYDLNPGSTAIQLRDQMLLTFRTNVEPLYSQYLAQTPADQQMTLFEIVTMAAIVERESVQPEESPIIASLYLNRLRLPMKLDADPTVQYAIGYRDGRWWPRLTGQNDYYALGVVQEKPAYNTYLKQDADPHLLPPGPIASPGLAAIRAVMQPATTQYYYMFSCDGSTHLFAMTLDEHNNNIATCQQ